MMRGVGGPLLCIADLLSDLSASTDGDLCSALETADKLLQTADTNSESLLEKIDVLNGILKRATLLLRSPGACVNRGM
ncbi:hypothetical protein QJS10_CPA06g02397 [Acorus calamus]|uniref:Uncharacterized protein n=1 Tax=Acorus calamus TaxID=4465 RepID=A0AAV9ELQ4_ACOCL|nr:hypothetical protein QJS10_CPA06g02397 [Acorus calamus]